MSPYTHTHTHTHHTQPNRLDRATESLTLRQITFIQSNFYSPAAHRLTADHKVLQLQAHGCYMTTKLNVFQADKTKNYGFKVSVFYQQH